MAPLQERIEEGDRQLRLLRAEAETLSIVARYLEEARRRVLKSSIEILEDEASQILRALTNNQWQRVKLDRHTLAAEITADGDNWMKVNIFSFQRNGRCTASGVATGSGQDHFRRDQTADHT